MKRGVFLDRDGVVNRMVYDAEHGTVDSPANPDQFEMMPGTAAAIRALNELELPVVVVSNQPGIAKGKMTGALLYAITEKMRAELAAAGAQLDGIYYCLHHPDAVLPGYRLQCNCRKPKPGLLQRAAHEMGISLADSWMIGDGLTDVQAGQAAGCVTVWLGTYKCNVCQMAREKNATPDLVAADLAEAVRLIAESINLAKA
jgi:D-glycero-D-manno-heptose 1,7-bisphosphate phosphatase